MNFLTYIAFTTFTASLITASVTIALALKIGSTRNINRVLIDQIGAHIECTNILIEKQYIEGNYEALNNLLVNQLINYREIRELLKEDKHEYQSIVLDAVKQETTA